VSEDDLPPEPDRVGDAPHPRETAVLFGQDTAEARFLEAWASGRLHHAWLLRGPRGVGKATLAYRIARALIAAPSEAGPSLFGEAEPAIPETLDHDPEDPVFRRIAAMGEPRLCVIRRPWDEKTKKLKTVITVEETRKLRDFLGLSAADGGWRVVIVDPADEMNVSAANALLKLLEEPPAKTVFLLVSHSPARLLPTIRSRCRTLDLSPLSSAEVGRVLENCGVEVSETEIAALTALGGGSAGEALRLIEVGGPAIYRELLKLLSGAPNLNRTAMRKLADSAAGRDAAQRYEAVVSLLSLLLARIARLGAGGADPAALDEERKLAAQLCPTPAAARVWAEARVRIDARIAHARAVNIDPAQTVLDALFSVEDAARETRRAA